jgi:hypothetical protein
MCVGTITEFAKLKVDARRSLPSVLCSDEYDQIRYKYAWANVRTAQTQERRYLHSQTP